MGIKIKLKYKGMAKESIECLLHHLAVNLNY